MNRRQRVIRKRAREFAWVKSIRVGDILKSGNGVLRVVRRVSHRGEGLCKTSVAFTIRHCSWTHRCYTTMTGGDLATFGYQPVGHRRKLAKSEKEAQIQACIERQDRQFTCCDAEGIA